MRLSDKERWAIRGTVRRRFGTDARVMLFGSRTDNSRRGGDIDLYVETDLPAKEANRAKLLTITDIQLAIGEQKIDLVVSPLTDPTRLSSLTRTLRNNLSHDYPDSVDQTALTLNELYDQWPRLRLMYERIRDDYRRRDFSRSPTP